MNSQTQFNRQPQINNYSFQQQPALTNIQYQYPTQFKPEYAALNIRPQTQNQPLPPTSPNSLVSNLMKFGLLGAIPQLPQLPPAHQPTQPRLLSKTNFIKLTSDSLERYKIKTPFT